MNGYGDIMVVDMECPLLEPRSLVKASHYIEGTELEDRPGYFTVWVDPHAPRLMFRIALVNPGSLRTYTSMFAGIPSQSVETHPNS